MLLSLGNTKLGKNKLTTASFGLEAVKTCPGAKDCVKGCYALAGNYLFERVVNKQRERLARSKQPDFVATINFEVKETNVGAVRIHDSGDFYNLEYLNKWIEIAKSNPGVIFYAYTKSVHLFKKDVDNWMVKLPSNFVVTLSYGGKHDHLINPLKDKHALVFLSLEELVDSKYSDNSKYDDYAYDANILRVGLLAKKHRKKDGWINTLKNFEKVTNEKIG